MTLRETGTSAPWHAGKLDTLLAYLYAPLRPLTRRVKGRRVGERDYRPDDILLPRGFTAEVVTAGLHEPVHCTFDDEGRCYVVECGHKIDSAPRVVAVDLATGSQSVVYELPEEQWSMTGAVTGAAWRDGRLYLADTDRIVRIDPDGRVQDVVTGLPGRGDHQTNHPVFGPDGKLYWGQGSATNTGVVGADNAAYEWLPDHPDVHDVPAADVTLTGLNLTYKDVLGDLRETVECGAFVPFGTPTAAGQVIRGDVRCTGAVLRCDPDGSNLEVVAWGLRNPYGIAFSPDGRLFATEHGIDERGERYIVGDPEDFYEIIPGRWYGWPDYASGIRLDDPRWGTAGHNRAPLIADPPETDPPVPFATFSPHAGPNGFDFCRDPGFGFDGDAFVALFGDLAPVTTRPAVPVGFKIVRVDMRAGQVHDFAVNRQTGPASKLPHDGFERPSHCAFGPDGCLYVVDFGEIAIAPEVGGIRIRRGTGALWRIRRTADPVGQDPPKSTRIPRYALTTAAALTAAALTAAAAATWLTRRLTRRS
jgi:glucose/arabinose dehydrogenase